MERGVEILLSPYSIKEGYSEYRTEVNKMENKKQYLYYIEAYDTSNSIGKVCITDLEILSSSEKEALKQAKMLVSREVYSIRDIKSI